MVKDAFGLSTASQTFQRLMQALFSDMQFTSVLVYIDDLVVYGPDFETSLDRLRQLGDKLRAANLKLKPKKCKFFQKQIKFLGFVIESEKGIRTDPQKVETIKNWPQPESKKAVKSWLGVVGFYRRFIPKFSEIAKPLNALTAKEAVFDFNQACIDSFKTLKELLINAPLLGFPQDEGKFILTTDACNTGISGILSQIQGEKEVLLAYASRALTKSESIFCTTRLELLAIVHHLDLFRSYLLRGSFLVNTDHIALKYWQRFKNPEGQMARWLDFMSQFDMEIQHKPGKSIGHADGLSRKYEECVLRGHKKCFCDRFNDLEYEPPVVLESREFVEKSVQTNDIKVESYSCARVEITSDITTEIETSHIACQTSVMQIDDNELIHNNVVSIVPYFTHDQLVTAQAEDSDISPIIELKISSNEKPKWVEVSHLSCESKILISEWKRLQIKNGLLYRKWENIQGNIYWLQLVLPRKYRQLVLEQSHDSTLSGHCGVSRTLQKLKKRFFFPKMRNFVKDWVKTCAICQTRKTPNKLPKAPLQTYTVGCPFERIVVDLTGKYSESDSGNQWVVTFQDVFTKYTVAVPIKNATALEVSQAFLNHWICMFSVPLEIHSDKGSQFESELFNGVINLLGMTKTRCTTMNPQSNGSCERVQKSLIDMLNCVAESEPWNWDKLVPFCALAYNSNVNESTQETPAKMVFGVDFSLPSDFLVPPEIENDMFKDIKCNEEYVIKLQDHLHKVRESARQNLQKANLKHCKYYNNRLNYITYHRGEQVYYLHADRYASKEHNFKWKGPFTVVNQLSDCIYRIQEGHGKPCLVVHHNKLKKAYGREPVDISWLHKIPSPVMKEVESDSQESFLKIPSTSDKPVRVHKPPDRLGNWHYD